MTKKIILLGSCEEKINQKTMNKKLLTMTLAALTAAAAWAQDEDVYQHWDGVKYEYYWNGEAKVIHSPDVTGGIRILDKFTVGFTEFTVTSIGDYAFVGCSGLTDVFIPYSVRSIADDAFAFCGLSFVYVEDGNTVYNSLDDYSAIIKTETNELVCGCQNTVIPNSVTSIGNSAFNGCSGLTSVTIKNSTPPTIEKDYSYHINVPDVPINTLYVPYGSKAAYEAAAYWKDSKEIIEMEPEEDEIQGDVNGDGTVDVADIATIISIMAENARRLQLQEK